MKELASFRPQTGYGSRLREERERLGLSQSKFAAVGGVKRMTQYLYENDTHSPTLRYLVAVADVGADLQYIIFGTRHKPGRLDLEPELLRDIYRVVDEIGRDNKGKPLPLEVRLDFFGLLCTAYSGKDDDRIDVNAVRRMLGRVA